MLITFDEFLARLKQLGAVYRDVAPRTAKYPYWIYTYTNTQRLVASTGTRLIVNEYQVSLYTKGVEDELLPFIKTFDDVPFQPFRGIPGDENDETITDLYTYIEVIAGGQ